MKLSALEQIPLFTGHTVPQTLADTVALCRGLEDAGFSRFWLAEHHNTDHFLSSSPDLLMGHLLDATDHIRLGSGGVMAMHYGSLQMAERFSTLAAVHGDRVDMGLGRAPGGDMRSAHALNQGRVINPSSINELIAETVGLLNGSLPDNHPYASLTVTPQADARPQVWLLGSSGQSAAWAGSHGLDYAYAQFFTGSQNPRIMDVYRSNLAEGAPGRTLSAVCVSSADTREEALDQALMAANFRVSLGSGRPVVFMRPDEMPSQMRDLLREYVLANEETIFVGTHDDVAARLDEFRASHHVDELMLISYIDDVDVKLEQYRQLARRLID